MINNIESLVFLNKLKNELIPNQLLGKKYRFIKWMPNNGLQFMINAKAAVLSKPPLFSCLYVSIISNRIDLHS